MAKPRAVEQPRFHFNTPAWSDGLNWDQPQYYQTIRCGDIAGNGRAQILARSAIGMVGCYFPQNVQGDAMHVGNYPIRLPSGPDLTDAGGWDLPQYYTAIQLADIDGDGRAELIARGADGIRVYKWSAPTDNAIGPSGMTATLLATLDAWSDADGGDEKAQYATIQCADIDGDGQAEIVGRYHGGIQVWKYTPQTATGWTPLITLRHWTDESIGYNPETNSGGESYYLTIQCADIDGDGQDEILGRYDDGIEFFKWTPNAQDNKWPRLPNLVESQWNDSPYYLTIQCADIDGDGQAEVLGLTPTGIVVRKYDTATKTWGYLTELAHWSMAGLGPDNPEQYYLTIQCADVDGDGQDEILGRYDDGIEFFKWTPNAQDNKWPRLPSFTDWTTSEGWDRPQYYLTIHCADVDGDGKAEVIGRSAAGLEAWKYDAAAGSWVELTPDPAKVPFPPFEGAGATAYDYISRQLLPNSSDPLPSIRLQYSQSGDPETWSSTLTGMTAPPPGVSTEAWNHVKNQLLLEFSFVGPVRTYFTNSTTLITDLRGYRTALISEVAANVEISEDSPSGIDVTLANMVTGIVNAVAIAVSDGAGVAAGVFASTLGAALSGLPDDGRAAIESKVNELDTLILTQFTNALNANAGFVDQVLGDPNDTADPLGDWGMLQTLGTLASKGGPWMRPINYIDNAVASATDPMKLWVYQALMPVRYEIWYFVDKPDINPTAYYCQGTDAPDDAWWARDMGDGNYTLYVVLRGSYIFDYPSSSCMEEIWKLTSKEDFFLGKNGWNTMKRINMTDN